MCKAESNQSGTPLIEASIGLPLGKLRSQKS